MRKYRVTLTAEERAALQSLVTAGRASARRLAHARILLKADAADGGPAWADGRIAEAAEVSAATVARVRRRFVEWGLEAALSRKRQDKPSRERKLDGRGEARLVALACSPHPRAASAKTWPQRQRTTTLRRPLPLASGSGVWLESLWSGVLIELPYWNGDQ
jgi:hypothetical protein